MVTKRLPEIREDEVLSVVKVADVVSVLPEPRRSSGSAGLHPARHHLIPLAILAFFLLIR